MKPVAALNTTMKKFLPIFIVVSALALTFCKGKVTHDLTEAGMLAISGDFRVPAKVFQSFFEAMKRSGLPERKDPRSALFLVIADNYLAADYKSGKGGKIDPAISAEVEKVYFETLAYFIREKNPEALYKAYVKDITVPDTKAQKALFNDKAEAAYTNVPLIREAADKVVVATFGKTGEKKLTYSALFDSVGQSGKLHLFTAPNAESLKEMIHTHLRSEFLRDYVAAASDADKADFASLKRVVENSILSRNFRYDMGMENANPHAENSAIKERAKSVSLGRIKDYYEANKDKYKEVQTVDCRHIKLKNYDQAVDLRDKVEHGANMIEMVKKYSLADDKSAADPGMIAGIKNDVNLHKRPRVEALCMMPKQGGVDLVKDGDFYEVVKAEKRVDGYPPLDDTTHLKEDLAREIAALDLKQEFDAKKKSILKKVDIRINDAELGKIK